MSLTSVLGRGRRGSQFAGTPPDPVVSWKQALPLIALVGRMIGWPIEPDAIRRREDASASQAWQRLRAAYGRRR